MALDGKLDYRVNGYYLITKRFWNKLGVVVAFVGIELGDVEIDGAIGLVGIAALNDLLNKGNVLGDVLTDPCQAIGRENLSKFCNFQSTKIQKLNFALVSKNHSGFSYNFGVGP